MKLSIERVVHKRMERITESMILSKFKEKSHMNIFFAFGIFGPASKLKQVGIFIQIQNPHDECRFKRWWWIVDMGVQNPNFKLFKGITEPWVQILWQE